MKIKIKVEKFRLNLWVPSTIFSWKWIWKIGLKKAEIKDIDKATVTKFYQEFKKIKQNFKHLEIVRVESSDGSLVTIRL